jgi:hypothetical protein
MQFFLIKTTTIFFMTSEINQWGADLTLFFNGAELSCFWWFSPISSNNKTDCHNITEILLKVALNTITLTKDIDKNHSYAIFPYKNNNHIFYDF